MQEEFDIAILGRGAAAFSFAIKASELSHNQAKIVMIGYGFIGGTCVNVGCVPSKYILESAKLYQKMIHSSFPGISSDENSLDFRKLMESIENLTSGERKTKYEDVLTYYPNIHIMNGRGRFLGPDRLEVVNGNERSEISADNIVIATGSSSSYPNINGVKELKGSNFNNVKAHIPLSSSTIISKRLRELVNSGIISKSNTGGKLTYTLTEFGDRLLTSLEPFVKLVSDDATS